MWTEKEYSVDIMGAQVKKMHSDYILYKIVTLGCIVHRGYELVETSGTPQCGGVGSALHHWNEDATFLWATLRDHAAHSVLCQRNE